MQRRLYKNPGEIFTARYGVSQDFGVVLRYADFLLQEAGLSSEPPVNLALIYEHFGIPTPMLASLPEQQGILLDSEAGVILINQDDSVSRQRFTEGHELMELLFAAQEALAIRNGQRSPFEGWKKEQLCDQGSAALLMPSTSFLPKVHDLGISLATGFTLASLYETSLLATLFQMVKQGPGAHALVMWHHALKPSQVQNLPADGQLSFLSNDFTSSPQEKLRVWWAIYTRNWLNASIPKHKSIPSNSLIHHAYANEQIQRGMEHLILGRFQAHCSVEARHIKIGDSKCVVSLLHLSTDDCCSLSQTEVTL